MLEYNERIHNKIGNIGRAGIVLGIVMIVTGVALGTVSIIFGASAIRAKSHLIG